jgi:hypothetical protein
MELILVARPLRAKEKRSAEQRSRETGAIAPRKQTKLRRRVPEGQEDRLRALVTAQPDGTRRRTTAR